MTASRSFPDVHALARTLSARQRLLLRWRHGAAWTFAVAGVGLLTATAWRAAWPDASVLGLALAWGALWLGGLFWLLWRPRADDMRLVSAADFQVAGDQQLPTTLELERVEPGHPFLPLLRQRCESLLKRVDPASLIPFQLDRRALSALAFALVAFGLFLLPPSVWEWAQSQAALDQPLLSEEGKRLEKWAERLEELAKQEDLPAVRQLAAQVREAARKLQTDPQTSREAIEKLLGLAREAEALSQNRRGQARDAFGAEGVPRPESGSAEQAAERSADGITGGATSQRAERPQLRGPEFFFHDPGQFRTTTLQRAKAAEKPEEPEYSVPRRTRAARPQGELELQVLERARSLLTQTATDMQNRSIAQANNANPSSRAEAGEAIRDQSKEPMTAQGTQQDTWGAGLYSAAGPEAAQASNRSGEAPSAARVAGDREAEAPGESKFEESRISGTDEETEAEEYWVRQLPVLNARHVRADGSAPTFQQGVVTAQSQGAIPRAYRAVVRSYFLHLDQLTETGR
jgi:hypothetical protein